MSLSKQIEDLLVDEKLEALLTTSALKKISEMAEDVNDLELRLKGQNEEVIRLVRDVGKQVETLNELRTENTQLLEYAVDVANREKAITVLECTAKHQSQRVQDHKDMFGLVFRNAVVSKSVLENGSVPVTDTSGYVSQQPSHNDKTETITQE